MRPLSIALAVLLTSATASAHAMLEHAVPGAGESVSAPKAVALMFSENLEPTFSSVAVTDTSGKSVEAGPVTANGNAMSVPVKPLPPGNYRVVWHAVSVDTHRTQGTYRFTVK